MIEIQESGSGSEYEKYFQVHKNTKMGSVQEHTNEAGPECFKCGQVNLENVLFEGDDIRYFLKVCKVNFNSN